ncbi:1-deoxy-D-xylulose-5-phosphate reductoisomerase [Rubrobacter tropicus]|uniref:1-deoxy-D-xylulose 5-phosphate reductoisomerase n=1 Tax=Rubrobacter tropicus TaxID=2653851 RepID=A0A6G8Q926_9ACTN|nr:1-deoxy-D-xylulose-5-phosphate reductoisomerase [Rubrobacter tropicus]QIN82981.1 1-deoxy-D-xylulose-5-phosphate reductoisomerase [Rubrobacter tropicus]
MKRRLTILGSTGSIGLQALDVVRAHPDRFEVVGLSAGRSADVLREQAAEFSPDFVALENGDATVLNDLPCEVISGPGSAERLSEVPAEVVLNGIVGFAGLAATVGALGAGNRVALANKESLIAGGEWVMSLAKDNPLIPVDSEHSAIFQCLADRTDEEVRGILLTASGGPFFSTDKARLMEVGPEDALAHPTWKMGPKITIDSATMMNKGLEVIEAHHLFGADYDDVHVVVHRQSVVHGGVMFVDGSVVLHAALPDMRLPISYGVLYPDRVDVGAAPVPFDGASWTFEEPRSDVFRCLPLAVEAGKAGGAYPVALNAANEVAVEAFLDGRIQFLSIADAIEEVLATVPDFGKMQSMEAITAVDAWARDEARLKIERGVNA